VSPPIRQFGASISRCDLKTRLPWKTFGAVELPRAATIGSDFSRALSTTTVELPSSVQFVIAAVEFPSVLREIDELSSKRQPSRTTSALPAALTSSAWALGLPRPCRSPAVMRIDPVQPSAVRMECPLPTIAQRASFVPRTDRESAPARTRSWSRVSVFPASTTVSPESRARRISVSI
jgi:hypothetical protein